MEALGRLFDIGTGWVPVDLDTANGATGKRIALSGADAITFVVFLAVGATDDVVLDLQQHTAYVSGTSNDLDAAAVSDSVGVDHYYIKSEAALDNDELWTKVTQSEASEITLTGATYGDKQNIVVIEVSAAQLGEGYTHVSLNAASTTSTAHLGACLYFVHELRYQRKPSKLPNLLRPGAANA
jgi:hypothetical protein